MPFAVPFSVPPFDTHVRCHTKWERTGDLFCMVCGEGDFGMHPFCGAVVLSLSDRLSRKVTDFGTHLVRIGKNARGWEFLRIIFPALSCTAEIFIEEF